MLVRLLYASRATGAIDDALLASILEHAHTYNHEHGITGILCTSAQSGVFLQVLEGGRAEVNALYAMIQADPRHRDVTLLDYAEVTERKFPCWRMGSVNLNSVNLGTVLRFSERPSLDPFSMTGTSALSLLDELSSTASIITPE
jgi:hypothetical protein